jgi:hypothetical protein
MRNKTNLNRLLRESTSTGYNYHAPISLTTLCPTLHYLYNLVVVVLRVVFSVLVVIESAPVVSYCLLKSSLIRLIRCIGYRYSNV